MEDRDFKANGDILTENLIDRGHKKVEFNRNREHILTQDNEPKHRIKLILTDNRTLPNVKEAVKKHWNISQINNEFQEIFPEPSIICFRRNKILVDSP